MSTAVPAVSRPYALTALSFPVALINVASLPLQNVIQIANALSGLTSIVIATPNKVYSDFVNGHADQVSADIQAGLTTEAAAIQTFLQLPATIIGTDVSAIAGLFGGLGAPAASTLAPATSTLATATTNTPALTTAAPKALSAGVDLGSNALTVRSGAISPDVTKDQGETTTTGLADPTKDGTTPGANSNDDTTTADASSVNTNGTSHQATSTPNTEGGQDVSNTTNTNTSGGRHRAGGTASHTTNTNAPGRHRAGATASGSNAGTSSASSSAADSKK